jgi:hypothetical protein
LDARYRCIFPLYTLFIEFTGSGRGFDLGVEVADGNIAKYTARRIVEISMIADDCQPLKTHLHEVIYVP